jgi:apolipoprotein N-acyltransferase
VGAAILAWSGSPLAWAIWVLLAIIQGLWFGLFGWVAWWIRRGVGGDARLLLTATGWVVVEWLRTLGGFSMPWCLSGYALFRSHAIIQIAEVTGVFGVSLLVALVNASVAAALSRRTPVADAAIRKRSAVRIAGVTADVGVLVLPCLCYAGALTYGLMTVGLPWQGRPALVAAVQPNFRSTGEPLPQREALIRLATATRDLMESAPSLTVWPESATPADAVNDREVNATFAQFAQLTGGHHLTGTRYTDEAGRERNSAVLFAPHIGLVSRYDKERLVPFAEWVPGRAALRPFAKLLRIPEADLTSGRDQKPLEAGDMRLGVMICYESVYPSVARARVRGGADLLVSITNDGWAGPSSCLEQHYAMTVFRAVETRRFVCVAGLTGLTGIITPTGAGGTAKPDAPAIVSDLLYLRDGLTPYARWGDWLVALCGILTAAGLRRGMAAR